MTAQFERLVMTCRHRLKRVERQLDLALQDEERCRLDHEQVSQRVISLQRSMNSVQGDVLVGVSRELHAVRAADDYRQSLEAEIDALQSALQTSAAKLTAATRRRQRVARARRAAATKLERAEAQQRIEQQRALRLEMGRTEEQALEAWTVARARAG